MPSRFDHLTDDELLSASLKSGEAFAAFYRRHVDAVVAYLGARCSDAETAADLTQETFAAALVSAHRYTPGRVPAAAWLFGIARKKLIDSYRRGRVERAAVAKLGLEPIAVDDEDLARVLDLGSIGRDPQAFAALLELPDSVGTAVAARILDEDPYPEIARRLQTSEVVVRQRVSRGLRTLRKRLERTS